MSNLENALSIPLCLTRDVDHMHLCGLPRNVEETSKLFEPRYNLKILISRVETRKHGETVGRLTMLFTGFASLEEGFHSEVARSGKEPVWFGCNRFVEDKT